MFRKNAVLASALAAAAMAALTTSGAFAAPSYNITALGTLDSSFSEAYGINNIGQVVGDSGAAGGHPHAFLWTAGGTNGVSGNPQMQDLGTIQGGSSSYATGINDSGQVVGHSNTGGNYGYFHAFLYSGGAITDLGTLGGATGSYATAINDSGQVVGYASTAGSPSNAFLWTAGGTNGVSTNPQMQDLGTLSNGYRSYATAINGSGQVAGYSDSTSTSEVPRLFLYSGGNMSAIGKSGSYATGINDFGQVVGTSFFTGASSDAFLYTSGNTIDLGALGTSGSGANGINDSGQVVGDSYLGSNPYINAFIYSGGVMTNLNSLLPSGSGWSLSSATAINRNGDIVGFGVAPDGITEAFLLTPTPEPTALALIAIGGMALLLMRGRGRIAG